MINLKDLNTFQIFLRLLAGRIGQLRNYTSLSNDVGVSAQTINHFRSLGLEKEIVPRVVYGGEKNLNYKGIDILNLNDMISRKTAAPS